MFGYKLTISLNQAVDRKSPSASTNPRSGIVFRTYVRRWHGFPSRDEAKLESKHAADLVEGFRGSDSRLHCEFRDLAGGQSVYQCSNLGPSTAPATVHKTIVPPYQSVMKGNRSSMQCKA